MTDPSEDLGRALSVLPIFRGLTWRAADYEVAGPTPATIPIPTSRDLRVATENFDAVGAHLILSTSGREIGSLAARPSNQEVVLLPGATLVPVTGQHVVAGLAVQVLLEMPAPGEPLPATPDDDEIASIVEAARARDDVAIGSPGRYGA